MALEPEEIIHVAGKRNVWKMLQEFFFKGDFYFLFFFSLRESWVAQHLKAPMYLPEHHHQGAERHFQPSKSSLALWRSLPLPKEIIIVLCYITAPGCTSWWLF